MMAEDVVNKRTYIEIFSSVQDLFYSLQSRMRDDVTYAGIRAFLQESLILTSSLINLDALTSTSVHQNPATDNPFVAKNQNLYFRGRCIWFDF